MDYEDIKKNILKTIDDLRPSVIDLSHRLHANPELPFQEVKAAEWQNELLTSYGFKVTQPFCSLETAFKAVYKSNENGPTVAFLAEYDALMGRHVCGHNMIAAASNCSAIALSRFIEELGGAVVVVGCPGEEEGGGKVILVENGGFDGIDFALMMHPRFETMVRRPPLMAATKMYVEFFGKEAHPSHYDESINALTSLITLFNLSDAQRPQWPEGHTFTGIICHGGKAANVVPGYAKGCFDLRAKKQSQLLKMVEDMKRLINASAISTGASFDFSLGPIYSDGVFNVTMEERLKKHLESLGEPVHYGDPDERTGASDIANVSKIIPTIHEYIRMSEFRCHDHRFEEDVIKPRADEAIILMAKSMALVGLDLLTDNDFRTEVRKEFNKNRSL